MIESLEMQVASMLYHDCRIALLVTDGEDNVVLSNTQAKSIMGCVPEGQKRLASYDQQRPQEHYLEFVQRVRREDPEGDLKEFEYPFRREDGSILWLAVSSKQIDRSNFRLWTAVDISNRKKTEQELSDLRERLEYAIEGNQDIVWDWDIKNNSFEISTRLKELVGYDQTEVPYSIKEWRKILHPEDRRKVLGKIQACIDGKNKYLDTVYRLYHKSDRILWILLRAVTLYDVSGKAIRMVGTHRDITHTKEMEFRLQEQAETIEQQRDALWHQAHHDALTTLPNRTYFQQLLTQAITHADTHGEKLALLFVDLDRFKTINDTYGHEVGDHVLCHVADLLRRGIRKDDVVARLGGDEFTLILPNVSDRKRIDHLVKKLMVMFRHPFEWPGGSLEISISVGIAFYPEDARDVDGLLRCADQAMYRVKRSGKGGYQLYHHALSKDPRNSI